jgi:hypothetical protein
VKKANSDAIHDIKDMHRGLHIAMDHLINRDDPSEAEKILRELDERMSRWLNQTKKI